MVSVWDLGAALFNVWRRRVAACTISGIISGLTFLVLFAFDCMVLLIPQHEMKSKAERARLWLGAKLLDKEK